MAKTAAATARRRAQGAMMPVERPNPIGRLSKFKPEYCEVVETWGRQGKSKMEMASLLNVDRKTILQWEGDFPDFGQAMARASVHAQAWWEGKAQKSLGKRHFQAQLWRYSMSGRFKEDYAEQRQGDSGGFDLTAFVGALGAAIHGPGASAKVIDAQPVKDDAAAEPPPVEGKHR